MVIEPLSKSLPQDLPEGYYLDNFQFLLEFVSSRYEGLLSADEKEFLQTFIDLPDDAKKLYVRLTNRKGPYFRVDKLNYPEIRDLSSSIELLVSVSLLSLAVPDNETAIGLCSKDELLALPALNSCSRSVKRSDLVEKLLQDPACSPTSELGLKVVEVLGLSHLEIFKLLFFGNFRQGMTEFVLHELVNPFESYDLSEQVSAFTNREVVDQSILLKNLSDLSYELIESGLDRDQAMDFVGYLPGRMENPMLARRHDRIVNRIGRHLERCAAYPEALAVYERARAAPSRERRARILEKLGQPAAALLLCQDIRNEPLDEAEYEFASAFGHRLAKKHRLETSLPRLEKRSPAQQTVRIPRHHERVEQNAVDHFNAGGASCYYVENTLFRSLFGLAFWDIIFAPVPGAFFHPFQRGPLDLFTSDFVSGRRNLIQERLHNLKDSQWLMKHVTRIYVEKYGTANQFVSWGWLTTELLDLTLRHIPAQHFVLIFERLLIDLKNNTSGLPDLVVFEDAAYRLIEIKGPGDKIQQNQARWFRFFSDHQIPAELVNVEYLND